MSSQRYSPEFKDEAVSQFVMHRVKVAGQINFDHPATRRIGTVLKLKLHGTDGMMHTALRPKAITCRLYSMNLLLLLAMLFGELACMTVAC